MMSSLKMITLNFRGIDIMFAVLLVIIAISCCKDPCEIDPESCSDPKDSIPSNIFVEVEVDTTVLKGFPIIDVHQHIYSSSTLWTPNFPTQGFKYYDTNIKHYETLVQRMHENNVVLAVAGGTLEVVEEFYENYPANRSMFLYSSEFWEMEKEGLSVIISEVERDVSQQIIQSIGELCGVYRDFPLYDSAYLALYAVADSFSIPVFLHTGIVPDAILINFPNYNYEYGNPANLKPILEMYPEVNFNAAHIGMSSNPDYDFEDQVIGMMVKYDNFYVDLGMTMFWDENGKQKTEAFLRKAIDGDVINKVLYGSDEMIFPDLITASINYIKQADYLTDTIRKQILYWNAASFLELSGEEIAAHFSR